MLLSGPPAPGSATVAGPGDESRARGLLGMGLGQRRQLTVKSLRETDQLGTDGAYRVD